MVFVHPTSPPHADAVTSGRPRPMLEFVFDSARAAADLVFAGVQARYPRIEWIFTHGGGALPLLAGRMEMFRLALGLGGDPVRDRLRGLWFDLAGTPFPDQVPAVDRAFGTGKLLYGSDYCWTPADLVLGQLATVDAAPGGWRSLTTGNAERLFARLGSQHP